MSATETNLAQALLAFQADAPPIHLDATNPHFKNKYASLGGVVAAIRPALNKHGLVYTQLPTNLDGQPALRTVLMHAESGQALEDTMPLILSKQDSQAQGSALTYGRRYALLSILGLVGDDDDDANAATRTPDAAAPAETDPHGLRAARADAPAAGDASSVVLTFGKHNGTPIRDVPRQYLEWWIEQPEPNTAALKQQRTAAKAFLGGTVEPAVSSDEDIPF